VVGVIHLAPLADPDRPRRSWVSRLDDWPGSGRTTHRGWAFVGLGRMPRPRATYAGIDSLILLI
jgi:hypothetical protein